MSLAVKGGVAQELKCAGTSRKFRGSNVSVITSLFASSTARRPFARSFRGICQSRAGVSAIAVAIVIAIATAVPMGSVALFASTKDDGLADSAAATALVADPAADLPSAVIEEVSEADLAPTRSATPAADALADGGAAVVASDLPRTVGRDDFRELIDNSPFTRALNLSDSLILTGVARVGGKPMATLMNTETKETFVISDVPNPQGWKMVEISSGSDLETVTAKISVSGGEVVTVRFDENRLKPGEAKPGGGGSGGSTSGETDEEKRKRYEEFRQKMDKLSDDQKDKMRKIVEKKRAENPNMTREEMGQAYREAMEKVSSERDKGTGRDR